MKCIGNAAQRRDETGKVRPPVDAKIRPGANRRGFTLAEFLVVSTILGALLGLSLRGILSARENARRNHCNNRMKQLGLSLQNHHDVNKKFPACTSINRSSVTPNQSADQFQPLANATTPGPGAGATSGYSWIVRILPYIEETAFYNYLSTTSSKFTCVPFDPANTVLMQGRVRHFSTIPLDVLICPSYSGNPISSQSAAGIYAGVVGVNTAASPPVGVAISNYTAMAATHIECVRTPVTTTSAAAEPPNGGMGLTEPVTMRLITDGLSKTIILVETKEPALASWAEGSTAFVVACNPNTASPTMNATTKFWTVGATTTTALNFGPKPDNAENSAYLTKSNQGKLQYPTINTPGGAAASRWWGPSSEHNGGVVIHCMADGSVKNLVDNIDPSLYIRLTTRAGHESVESGIND